MTGEQPLLWEDMVFTEKRPQKGNLSFSGASDLGLRRQDPRGLTFPGQALRPQLCSGSLRGALAGDRRQQALGHLRVLGPRHEDLLQAVDEALQGAVPGGDSHGTYKTSQGQGHPDDGSDGNPRRSEIPTCVDKDTCHVRLSGGRDERAAPQACVNARASVSLPCSAPGHAPLSASHLSPGSLSPVFHGPSSCWGYR